MAAMNRRCVVCMERPSNMPAHSIALCEPCDRSSSFGYTPGELIQWAARRARAYERKRNRKKRP